MTVAEAPAKQKSLLKADEFKKDDLVTRVGEEPMQVYRVMATPIRKAREINEEVVQNLMHMTIRCVTADSPDANRQRTFHEREPEFHQFAKLYVK